MKFLQKITGIRHIYPFYHIVNDEPPAHVRNLYPVKTLRQFEADLDFYLTHYKACDFPEILTEKQAAFHLSFDDGLRECYDIIAPVLLKKGIPASFFINSDFVDNKALFYKYKISLILDKLKGQISESQKKELLKLSGNQGVVSFVSALKYEDIALINKIARILELDFSDYLNTAKPYMTSAEIGKLQAKGFRIGAHSADHPLYADISLEEQIRQTADSLNFVRENFKIQAPFFAFPFTDTGVSRQFFERLSAQNITRHTFGTAGIKLSEFDFNIQRIAVERNQSAEKYIKFRYIVYFLRKLQGRHIISYA